MLELPIGLSPEHSTPHSSPSATRSPQETLTLFLTGSESRELLATERRELAALSREQDAELFHSGLLHLAGRIENRDNLALASQLYAMVQGQSRDSRLRSRAENRLALFQGGGHFGDRFEFHAQRFFGHAADPVALGSMALGGAAFRMARLGMLGRLLSSSSANWATRGFGARALANGGAFLTESTAFVLAGRGLGAMAGRNQDWSFRSLSHEWAAGAITLASLRGFGAAGSGLFRRVHGANPSAWQALYSQTAMFGGILAAHRLETSLGLRPATQGSNALFDGLVTLLQFNVAGRILRDGLGPRWQAWEHGLDQRASSLSWNFPRPSGPSMPWMGFGRAPALVGPGQHPLRASPDRKTSHLLFMEGPPKGESAERPVNGAGESQPAGEPGSVESSEKLPSWWPTGTFKIEAVRTFIDAFPDTTVFFEFLPREPGQGIAGRILMVNQRVQEKFGYTPEEAAGLPLSRFTRPEDAALMRRMQRTITNRGQIKFPEVPFVRKDGSELYCDVSGNVLQVGDRTFGIAILQDVSQRRQDQAQVQAERARFRALLKGVPDIMLRITGEGRILDAHYEHPENFPVPMGAVLGLAVKDIPAPPHLVELALSTIRAALESGEPQLREYVLPMPDGRQLIQEGRMMKSGENEIVATIRDVTEARQAENHRIAAARAESIKLMGRGLAHDVANALVPLMGYIEFSLRIVNGARESHSGLPLEKLNSLADDLQIASEWAGRLRDMVAGFRELSTEPATGAPFDLQQLLDPTTLRAMLGPNVELRVRRSAEPWPVPGPRQNIQRVIQNLVGNANDAMQGSPGVLRVEVDRVVLSSQDLRRLSAPDVVNRHGGNFTRLRVQDTGSGIAPENLERIFEPYFSTKKQEEGAGHGGLGLALANKLVRDAGGFFVVESYVGLGTTFDLYLPFVQPPPPSTEAIRNLPEIHSKTILVVSPDPALHESVQSTLGERGFTRILFVPGYEQALESAAAHPGGIDALLTDFRLPDNMYGIKLMAALRSNHPNLPTIIWTEHDASAYTNVAGSFGKVMERSTVNSQLGPTLEGLISRSLQHRE